MNYKKVIAINSSKRKKNTYKILNDIKKQLSNKNIEIEILNLFDFQIENCLGCESCIRGKSCPINDDTDIIMEKLISCDGVILSSPVYVSNISGKLKTFIDRTCVWFHRPELVGKPALLISTTAGSDLNYVLNYLQKVSIEWGLHPTNKIRRSVKNIHKTISSSEYNDFVNHLYMSTEEYKPSLKQLFMFQVQKVLALKILKIDYDYWKQNNWHDKIYYYDNSASIIKKYLANMFFKFMYKRVNKVGD